MLKTIAISAVVLTLAACSVATRQIDDATGTTLAERCMDYRLALTMARIVADDPETDADVLKWQEAIDAYCDALAPVEPAPLPPVDGGA